MRNVGNLWRICKREIGGVEFCRLSRDLLLRPRVSWSFVARLILAIIAWTCFIDNITTINIYSISYDLLRFSEARVLWIKVINNFINSSNTFYFTVSTFSIFFPAFASFTFDIPCIHASTKDPWTNCYSGLRKTHSASSLFLETTHFRSLAIPNVSRKKKNKLSRTRT